MADILNYNGRDRNLKDCLKNEKVVREAKLREQLLNYEDNLPAKGIPASQKGIYLSKYSPTNLYNAFYRSRKQPNLQ